MTHFLVDLQEAASASVRFGTYSQPGPTGTTSGTISVLRFVRADVDNWISDELQRLSTVDGDGIRQSSQNDEEAEMAESAWSQVDLEGAHSLREDA